MRNASGTYSLAAGNPVGFRQRPISSALWNATMVDIRDEITDSLSRSGKGGMQAKLVLAMGTTAKASITLPHGVAPNFPDNGDMWTTTSGLFVRINNATVGPITAADLSNLNASNLTSGTVPNARFPSVLPAVSGANLTNLNATNLATGTVPDARFPSTLPIVSGINLTNLNATNLASGTVPDARFPSTLPAVSGANLTNLNASNLATGTVANGRLPSTISQTLFSAAEFDAGTSGTAKTITWSNGQNQKLTLTGDVTLTFASPVAGMTAKLKIVQGASPYTITWPTIKWAGASAPTISTANGAIDIVSLYYDGTNYYGVHAANFG